MSLYSQSICKGFLPHSSGAASASQDVHSFGRARYAIGTHFTVGYLKAVAIPLSEMLTALFKF